jgi:tRNA(His) 5'-end guanylyltransferase
MDHAARMVMGEYKDIVLAFGESDEFRYERWRCLINHSRCPIPVASFLLRKSCTLYNRRCSKIITTLTSLFTSSYVMLWHRYFPSTTLQYPPSFDGRLVMYPGEKEVKDYFAWRQADSKHTYMREIVVLNIHLKHTSITCTTPSFGHLCKTRAKQPLKLMKLYVCDKLSFALLA